MAVDISQGGLKWEASIGTGQLEKDINYIEKLMSGAKLEINVEDANKGIQEIQKTIEEATKKASVFVQAASDELKGLNQVITVDGSKAQEALTNNTKNEIQERINASQKEVDAIFAMQKELAASGSRDAVALNVGTGNRTRPAAAQNNPVADAIGKDFANIITQAENAYNGLDAETKAFIDELVELQTQLKQVEAAQKSLNKANADGKVSAQDYADTASVLTAQQRQVSESIDLVIKRQKDYDALNNASITSLNEKKATLNQLRQSYNDLTKAERDSASGQDLAAQIKDLKVEIASLDPERIAKVKDGVKGAYAELNQLKNQMAGGQLSGEALDKATSRAVQLQHEIDNLTKKIKLASSNTAGIDALAQSVRGLVGGYTAFSGIAGLFNSNNEQTEKVIKNVTSAMAVLNGVQEIATILAKDSQLNEYLRLQLMKLRTTATVEQAAATTGLAVAEGAQVVATETATAAQVGLNTAMLANPAGILLLALTAVVVGITAMTGANERAREKQLALNDAIKQANDVLIQLAELTNQTGQARIRIAERELAIAQSRGDSEAKIYELTQKLNDEKIKLAVEDISSLHITEQQVIENEKLLKSLREQEKTQADIVKTAAERKVKPLTKDELRAIQEDNIRKGLDSYTGILDDLNGTTTQADKAKKNLEDTRSRIASLENITKAGRDAVSRIEDASIAKTAENARREKQLRDDALRSTVAYWEARLKAAEKGSAEERNAAIGLSSAQYTQTAANPNITSGELAKAAEDREKAIYEAEKKYDLSRIQDSKNLIEKQLAVVKEGSLAELQYKKLLLQLDAQQQVINAEQNATAIGKINAESEKAIAELKKKYRLDALRVELEGEIANTNTLLSQVKKGSEQELLIKKQLVDDKALLDDLSLQGSIKNEQLLAAKVKEVYAKSLVDKRNLDEAYYAARLKKDIDSLEKGSLMFEAYYNRTINNPNANRSQIYDAQIKQLQGRISTWQSEINRINQDLSEGKGDAQELQNKVLELQGKIQDALNKIQNLDAKKSIELLNRVSGIVNGVSSAFSSLSQALQGVDDDLSATLDTLASFSKVAGDAIASAASFASGDVGGGIASAASAIAGVFSIGARARESERQAREEIEKFNLGILQGEIDINVQYRERQLLQKKTNDLKLQGLKDEKKQLEENQKKSFDDYNRILKLIQNESYIAGQTTEKYGGLFGIGKKTRVVDQLGSLTGMSYDQIEQLFMSGQLTDKAEQLFKSLQNLKQEGADIEQQLLDLQKQAQEIYTGTTSDSILDGIVEGFKNGLRSAADFANNFEELMKGAILNSFKYQALEKPLQEFYDKFAADAQSGDMLTQAEIDQLQNYYNQIIDNAGKQFENLQQITGKNLSGTSGGGTALAGAIKGMTEQQADLLAGQFGGLRLTALDLLNVSNQSLRVMYDIRDNTARLLTIEKILRDQQLNGLKIKP